MDIRKVGVLPNESATSKKTNSRPLQIGLLIVILLVVGSVFASSNISINGGKPLALGAGVVAVTNCDDNIKIDAASEFQSDLINFRLKNLTLSEIATSSYTNSAGFHPGCSGTDLRINFYHKTSGGFETLNCEQIGYVADSDVSEGIEPSPQYATCIDSGDVGSLFLRVLHGDGDPVKYEIKNLDIDPTLVDSVSIISLTHDYPLTVGSVGPGGGTIFYINNRGFQCGADLTAICHYLEVAPKGWSGEAIDPKYPFAKPAFNTVAVPGVQNTPSINYGTVIGEGLFDTLAVEAQNGRCESVATCDYAAGAARAYSGGGFHDWYLANQAESTYLATARINFAKFKIETISERTDLSLADRIAGGQDYWNSWASNPGAPNAATSTTFGGTNRGYSGGYKGKDSLFRVRPIRAY